MTGEAKRRSGRRRHLGIALLIATVVGGCGGDRSGETDTGLLPGAIGAGSPGIATSYAPELGIDLSVMTELESGVYIRDTQPGEGEPADSGQTLRVFYTGWLPIGVEFDTNRDGSDPMTFTIGSGDMLTGWDQGVTGMRAGGRRLIVIPPEQAFGERGLPGVIPPYSTLVFDVQVVEIVPQTTTTGEN